MAHSKYTRRDFLGEASCAALGSMTMLSSLTNLKLLNALAQPAAVSSNNDYKALVCILLAGGNDSFNLLVPKETGEYEAYKVTRSDLALPNEVTPEGLLAPTLPISPLNTGGRAFGVHPSMPGVQQLFSQGNLAFLANIGTLIQPIANESEYRSGLKKIPLGLYSHSDQIQQWQTSIPQNREAIGWGGRLSDILMSTNANQRISMNISLSGRNVFQAGNMTLEYTISNQGNGSEGITPVSGYGYNGLLQRIRDNAVNSLLEDVYSNIFQSTISSLTKDSIDAQKEFANAIAQVPPFGTTFSAHYLSQNLRMVAKVIAARERLGFARQTFFMTFGGWDHHDEVLNNQLNMLGIVNNALREFYTVLEELNITDKVTTFTISDFARTLTSNGRGSDHAWGGNQIVMGGAVQGQRILGQFPDLSLSNNPLNVSDRGVMIPTTSTDSFFAEMALWYGVSPNDLTKILPNIGNFYSPGSGTPPIGFLL
jgi:uncharacterized protein (DUF1501 family)